MNDITSVVNPAYVEAPYKVSFLIGCPALGRRDWSRKRRLKARRRFFRRQEREAKLMRLVTAAMVENCKTIETRILGMVLAAGPRLFAPRPFYPPPLIRPVPRFPFSDYAGESDFK